jgi:hypothetical protein
MVFNFNMQQLTPTDSQIGKAGSAEDAILLSQLRSVDKIADFTCRNSGKKLTNFPL